jgi:hypothetical protein
MTNITLTPQVTNVTISPRGGVAVVVQARPINNITIATRGLQGPKGDAGLDGDAVTIVAAKALGGHRVVTAQGLHCMPDTLNIIIGITVGAGALGTEVEYLPFGPMTENSWSWTPNAPIFAGSNGVLTQTEPAGNSRRVAFAITETTIAVDLQPTIYRS